MSHQVLNMKPIRTDRFIIQDMGQEAFPAADQGSKTALFEGSGDVLQRGYRWMIWAEDRVPPGGGRQEASVWRG